METETLRTEVDNYKKLLVESHQAIDGLRAKHGPVSDNTVVQSYQKELDDSKRIMVDQAAELERIRLELKSTQDALNIARQKMNEMEDIFNNGYRARTPIQGQTVMEDTIIQYRKDIERLEQVTLSAVLEFTA